MGGPLTSAAIGADAAPEVISAEAPGGLLDAAMFYLVAGVAVMASRSTAAQRNTRVSSATVEIAGAKASVLAPVTKLLLSIGAPALWPLIRKTTAAAISLSMVRE